MAPNAGHYLREAQESSMHSIADVSEQSLASAALSNGRSVSLVKKRWRDIVRKDLSAIEVEENVWYDEATLSRTRLKPVNEQRGAVLCNNCGRWFRSRGGLAVHACRPGGQS